MRDGEEDKGDIHLNYAQCKAMLEPSAIFFFPVSAISEYLARTKAEVGG